MQCTFSFYLPGLSFKTIAMKTKLRFSTFLIFLLTILICVPLLLTAKESTPFNDHELYGQAIRDFYLVDADTDTDITLFRDGFIFPFEEIDGKHLNIRVNPEGDQTGISVEFKLTGSLNRTWTERQLPYALFGDINGDFNGRILPPGEYHLRASAYHEQGGHINTIEVNFAVPDPNGIRGIEMITAANLLATGGGLTTDLLSFDQQPFNADEAAYIQNPKTFVALVGEDFTGSVKLTIEGTPAWGSSMRIENINPYSMFGDRAHLSNIPIANDYNMRFMPNGSYFITATPYSLPNGKGTAGLTLSVSIVLTNINPIQFEFQSETSEFQVPFTPIRSGFTYFPNLTGDFAGETALKASLVPDQPIGSMMLEIDGPIKYNRIENQAPYTFFGDANGMFNTRNFPPGLYDITATVFPQPNGNGEPIFSQIGRFVINSEDEYVVTLIRIVEAATQTEIANMDFAETGTIIDSAVTPTDNATIVVNWECDVFNSCPSSVLLELNGPITASQIENVRPYTLFGDSGGIFNGRALPEGVYTLKITPYNGPDATGNAIQIITREFQIIDSQSTNLKSILYPNPTKSVVHLDTGETTIQAVSVIDMNGREVMQVPHMNASKTLDVSRLEKGIYIVRMYMEKGTQTKKLIIQ